MGVLLDDVEVAVVGVKVVKVGAAAAMID